MGMRVTGVGRRQSSLVAIPAPPKACCATFWVSHNLSVFSFLRGRDKAPMLFIHLLQRSVVKVS